MKTFRKSIFSGPKLKTLGGDPAMTVKFFASYQKPKTLKQLLRDKLEEILPSFFS